MNSLVPGLTTLLTSGKDDLVKTVSRIIQNQQKEGGFRAVAGEWQRMVQEGKIKPEYAETEQAAECRVEMFDSLDKDKPDQKRTEAMKKIFLKAAASPSSEWANPRPQQLLRICRTLNAEELIILGTAYRLFKTRTREEVEKSSRGADQWPDYIAGASQNLVSAGIVDFYEDDLVKKKLIGDRDHSDRSGVRLAHQCRLTNLAIELCKYLQE